MADKLLWEDPLREGKLSDSAKAYPHDFDIHAGGADLQFPHHENEIAQSVCACEGSSFARVWLHNGMIRVGGQKMAKSLGNFTTVHDLRETTPGEVIRLVMLMTHYRAPLDWTESRVEEARKTLTKWSRFLGGVDYEREETVVVASQNPTPDPQVVDALADDLNTTLAIARLHALASERPSFEKIRVFEHSLDLLGFDPEGIAGFGEVSFDNYVELRIDDLLAERLEARKAKDFARADAIRDGLTAAGVMVKDAAGGAEWELTPAFDAAKLAEVEA